jgi:hypothetical protein
MKPEDKAKVQQALEALERAERDGGWSIETTKAITALRQLLERTEQEPNEWLTGCPECGMDSGCDCDSGTWNPPAPPADHGDELTKILNNPEEHYPGNFDTPERANALLTGLCQEAATEIERLNKALKGKNGAQPDDHGDELTIAYLDGVHTGKQLAKREWVGLTDEERWEVTSKKWWNWEDEFDIEGFARAIEAKLREKNGGA